MAYRRLLSNGIRVVGEEIPSMRSVSIGIWIGTGSRYEVKSNNGISHFLEHMLFKGTSRFTARDLARRFDNIGGQVNAFTSKEYTCFYAKVLDMHFPIAVDTLADMLYGSKFAPEEIEKEKKVVIEEIRMYEDTPDELVMDILSENVYRDHPLGYTILGVEDNLKSFTRGDVQDYVSSRYTPRNIVIAVAGNVSETKAIEELESYFGTRSHEARVSHDIALEVPSFHWQSSVRQKDTEQVHLSLAAPGLRAGHDRLYAMILLNNALGSSPSSTLFQEIREERGLAYSVFSFHSAYRDCGMFGIYAGTSPEHVADVMTLITDICEKVALKGLTSEELNEGKEQVKGSMMLSLEGTSSRMSRLGKNELILGREVSLDETIRKIDAVTVADIQSIAAEIVGQKFALAAVGPVSEDVLSPWM